MHFQQHRTSKVSEKINKSLFNWIRNQKTYLKWYHQGVSEENEHGGIDVLPIEDIVMRDDVCGGSRVRITVLSILFLPYESYGAGDFCSRLNRYRGIPVIRL